MKKRSAGSSKWRPADLDVYRQYVKRSAEVLTEDSKNSNKGKHNTHHNKADSCKQQLVVKLIFVNRLRRAADTDAADRGRRTDDDAVCSDDDTAGIDDADHDSADGIKITDA